VEKEVGGGNDQAPAPAPGLLTRLAPQLGNNSGGSNHVDQVAYAKSRGYSEEQIKTWKSL
jgi:hypothetical protein